MKTLLSFSFFLFFFSVPAFAAANLGDPAPSLQIAEWIQGNEVKLAESGENAVHVIEFWATWCPPCRTSIPHLSELQKQFKDKNVTIIGISGEEADVVRRFVKQMGDRMTYSVAVDREGKTAEAYMKAFGIGGIPHAFVVDPQKQIVWHGHPMAGLEEALAELTAGNYDLKKAKLRNEAMLLLDQFYQRAARGEAGEEMNRLEARLKNLDSKLDGILPDQPFDPKMLRKTARFASLAAEYEHAVLEEAPADQIANLERQLQTVAPDDFNFADYKADLNLQHSFAKYYQAVTSPNQSDDIKKLAKQLAQSKSANPILLNDFAWTLLTDPDVAHRDAQLALSLAKAAVDVTQGKDPNVLDTYARALYETGRKKEAIEHQRKAVQLAEDNEFKADFESTLKRYQAGE